MTWREVKFRQWIWLNCAGISSSKTRNTMLSLKNNFVRDTPRPGKSSKLCWTFEIALRRSRNGNIPQCLQPFYSALEQTILIGARVKKMADKTLLSWDTSIIFSWTSLSWASSLSEFIFGHGLCNNNYLTAADCSVPRAADLQQGWRFYFVPFYIKIHSCAWNYLKEIVWNG